jgi:hypothetical protein
MGADGYKPDLYAMARDLGSIGRTDPKCLIHWPRGIAQSPNTLIHLEADGVTVLHQRIRDQAITSNTFDAGKTTQCFSAQKEFFTGDGIFLGYYQADVSLMETAGSALVSFSVTLPDNPQVLSGDQIKATRISPTAYKFRFVDGWGNSSKGLLAISGKRAKLTLEIEKYGSPSNISRNYGETKLNSSSCK